MRLFTTLKVTQIHQAKSNQNLLNANNSNAC